MQPLHRQKFPEKILTKKETDKLDFSKLKIYAYQKIPSKMNRQATHLGTYSQYIHLTKDSHPEYVNSYNKKHKLLTFILHRVIYAKNQFVYENVLNLIILKGNEN